MLLLSSLAALVSAQLLPGLLLVKLLDIGRSREERFVLAGVLGGAMSALIYWVSLVTSWEPLYFILLANVLLLALFVPFRNPPTSRWPRAARLALPALWIAVATPYLATTGSLYRLDEAGNMLLDQALQRDVLFHVGVTRSLEHAYPPALLSVAGEPVGYHVGYHLQLAAWARHFGIDAVDGLVRTGTLWQLALLIASAFVLASRFSSARFAQTLTPVLVLGAGLGFVFFFRDSVDWWSLAFLDVTLVSVFLANPLLPALPLLFCGLALLHDYVDEVGRGSLAGSVICFGFLFLVKMFLGAQVVAALALSAILKWRDRRLRFAAVVAALASLPFVAHTLVAAGGSNTSVSVRPLEIVRYAMEKLDFGPGIEALAAAGSFQASALEWSAAIGLTALWAAGFLGLRLAAVPGWVRDLRAEAPLRRTMASFVLIGFPVALVFRIAPAEAAGLSRLEAQNDVVWFAAASGLLLWFWVAESLPRRAALVLAALVALPGTVQHFAYAASLEPDRIAQERMFASRVARTLSPPDAIWLDPLDRSRPSVLPYFSGRAVVYDPYVGYDYMFVGRDDIEFRRHALAQFWSSGDPAFRAWVLEFFEVDFVWQAGPPIPSVFGLELVHTTDDVQLFRVNPYAVRRAAFLGIVSPRELPLGGAGSPYFGLGWERRGPTRALAPGRASLYLPRPAGQGLSLAWRVQPGHGGGVLVVDGERIDVRAGEMNVAIDLASREFAGLHAVELEWRGGRPLTVFELELTVP